MESRRLRMQATPRGGNTTPRRRLPAFVVEFNKAIVLLLLLAALGRFYEHGMGGLAKDLARARELYQLAADQGYTGTKEALARLGA